MKAETKAPGERLKELRTQKDELFEMNDVVVVKRLEEINRELAELAFENPRYINVVCAMQKEIADKIVDLNGGQVEGVA